VKHVLVLANETASGRALIERLAGREPDLVTVIAPVSAPAHGYVVYEDTRRAAAGRRLDKTLAALRAAGIRAHGMVVDSEPVDAVRDALATVEPPVTSIVVSTHPEPRSGWLRRDVVSQVRRVSGGLPVEHVVVDLAGEHEGEANVLVLANETVLGGPLLDRIRERAARSPASFLLISPQSDPTASEHPEAERRLRQALAVLRGEGIDAHGQIAHPDPFAAALEAVRDERVDEIVVSTFAPAKSPWLRRNLVQRLHLETKLPVEHVVVSEEQVVAS
jgi:hypothetical protein